MRVTANQVTFARLAAIPFLCAALYGGAGGRWAALALGMAVGFTDLLDGWLARKYGPTVLGGLMDPIADKVFVVAALLCYADLGWAPWWAAYAIVLRELLVTALRSSFELRRRSLRSTYLAKVKTWVQMFALAAVLAVEILPRGPMVVTFAAVPAAALGAGLVALALRRRWRGIWIFGAAFTAGAAVFIGLGADAFATATFLATALLTWISALDYVGGAARVLPPWRAFDVVRLAGAVLLAISATWCLARPGSLSWAIVLILALECAHGGLDNLLAGVDAAAPSWAWGARTASTAVLLVVAGRVAPRPADLLTLAALAVTLAGTVAEFWRQRRHYLVPRAATGLRGQPTT
jgi:CDP-diacylglycerol--glycerol-3-phosphate 3-phosphatidyltransferase